jgi:hypothetical protein
LLSGDQVSSPGGFRSAIHAQNRFDCQRLLLSLRGNWKRRKRENNEGRKEAGGYMGQGHSSGSGARPGFAGCLENSGASSKV